MLCPRLESLEGNNHMRNSLRRTLATTASVAIASAGLAALAPTASAVSEEMNFDCTVSILGVKTFKTLADTNLPDSVEQGKKVKVGFTATVTAPDDIRGSAAYLYGSKVEGTADIDVTIGSDSVKATTDLPLSDVPASGEWPLQVAGSGTWTPSTVGSQEVRLNGYTANLSFPQAGGTAKTLAVPCEVNKDTNNVVDTVEVTPSTVQATKTTGTVKYKKKAKKVVAKVQVTNADGTAAAGDVQAVLKQGKKKVKTKVALNKKGKKKIVFTKVAKKGKYTLVLKYKGSDSSTKSKRTVKFRVR